ncbi:hypothetical protein HY478_00930 [Candidatus Uhrbacteria bacterium]|nr:hypothetical protein [Candidatus Uhrbacteria bacterium]
MLRLVLGGQSTGGERGSPSVRSHHPLFDGATVTIFPREPGELRLIVSLGQTHDHPGPDWLALLEAAMIQLSVADLFLARANPFPDMPYTAVVVRDSVRWDDEQFGFSVQPGNERARAVFELILVRGRSVIREIDTVSITFEGTTEPVVLTNRAARGGSR